LSIGNLLFDQSDDFRGAIEVRGAVDSQGAVNFRGAVACGVGG